MSFQFKEVLPDIFHIEDALGVCMTLLSGRKEALLADAGYGLEDVAAFAASLTGRPVRLILTHGHYDHALGAGWFPEAAIFPEDMDLVREHENNSWKKRAWEAAVSRGILTEEGTFPSGEGSSAGRKLFPDHPPVFVPLKEGVTDLGGLSARVIHCPGHTRGSAVIFVPERELLLTGDNWNPCTWLFFKEALPVQEYRKNMQNLLNLPFRHVLCPHSSELFERSALEDFVLGLTDEKIRSAEPVDTGAWLGIRTFQAEPAPGQSLTFAKKS